ncbi:hypothetical protein FB451DRAFT_1396742 [Mycena latifolia]|nr:hypothetical protein FB451DRAFT_1396742 [Mycena latifolia]
MTLPGVRQARLLRSLGALMLVGVLHAVRRAHSDEPAPSAALQLANHVSVSARQRPGLRRSTRAIDEPRAYAGSVLDQHPDAEGSQPAHIQRKMQMCPTPVALRTSSPAVVALPKNQNLPRIPPPSRQRPHEAARPLTPFAFSSPPAA